MTPRREFPKSVKRAAWERADGICECHRIANVPGLVTGGCGQTLRPGNIFYEHIICDGIGGDPTLDNCVVLTKTCWRIKTDSYDRRVVAKAKRQADRDHGIGRSTRSPMPGARLSPWKQRMGRHWSKSWERRI